MIYHQFSGDLIRYTLKTLILLVFVLFNANLSSEARRKEVRDAWIWLL